MPQESLHITPQKQSLRNPPKNGDRRGEGESISHLCAVLGQSQKEMIVLHKSERALNHCVLKINGRIDCSVPSKSSSMLRDRSKQRWIGAAMVMHCSIWTMTYDLFQLEASTLHDKPGLDAAETRSRRHRPTETKDTLKATGEYCRRWNATAYLFPD
jgi:hypothetical protein